ncbi:MAG TPA: EVE domain-containing protein [Longimicrobiaceae bacterium]|nr:EVE domain-containing protein [Longimicrobiaceae bacterium]
MPRHWLFKSEPGSYSIDDLARDRRTHWDGIRNYQARNLLRDEVGAGDGVLVYHSNADPPGVAGVARVVRAGYPDPSALDPRSRYFDPKASTEDPRWFMVDIEFEERFPDLVPLSTLKETRGLEKMVVTTRSRLSIQPVTKAEYEIVAGLGRATE